MHESGSCQSPQRRHFGTLSQSLTECEVPPHLKHLEFGQFLDICPSWWQTKHLDSLFGFFKGGGPLSLLPFGALCLGGDSSLLEGALLLGAESSLLSLFTPEYSFLLVGDLLLGGESSLFVE